MVGVSGGKVLLASPRGYCAGVDRAVDAVERALAKHGAPVYVRKQIVHNLHVVRDLESKGAVFVEEETEVPRGAVVVLSAHGVAPDVYSNSRVRDLEVIDATCPLVTKVHLEAIRFAREGYTILLIGHEGHDEVLGTLGEAPNNIRLVQDEAEVDALDLEPAGFDLREVEQVLDDLEQEASRGADLVEVAALLAVERGLERERGHAQHGVERRADLVAHVREELGLEPRRVERLLALGGIGEPALRVVGRGVEPLQDDEFFEISVHKQKKPRRSRTGA